MTRKVNALDAADDIRRGMTPPEMMKKYGLSSVELRGLYKELKATNFLRGEAKDADAPSGREVGSRPRKCPSCGKGVPLAQDRCPDCGALAPRPRPERQLDVPEPKMPYPLGLVETWKRKPVVLFTSGVVTGALVMVLVVVAGAMVMNRGLSSGPIPKSQSTQDNGRAQTKIQILVPEKSEASARNIRLEQELEQRQQEIAQLKKVEGQARQQKEDLAAEKARVSRQLEEKQKRLDQALAKTRDLEKERNSAWARIQDPQRQKDETKLDLERALETRLLDDVKMFDQVRSTSEAVCMAILGNTEAQFRVGVCYYNGAQLKKKWDRFPRDGRIGVEWLRSAARKGHVQAQEALGKIKESW